MIEIYGTTTCKWCKAAVALVDQLQLKYEYRNLDENEQFYIELKNRNPDFKTVPQIWWNGKYIGGYSALAKEIGNTIESFDNGKI
jgi:glutaredoxin